MEVKQNGEAFDIGSAFEGEVEATLDVLFSVDNDVFGENGFAGGRISVCFGNGKADEASNGAIRIELHVNMLVWVEFGHCWRRHNTGRIRSQVFDDLFFV